MIRSFDCIIILIGYSLWLYAVLCFQVHPGDFLGFIGGSGKLGSKDDELQTVTAYAQSTSGAEWPEDSEQSTDHEFYLNAHIATFNDMHVRQMPCIRYCMCIYIIPQPTSSALPLHYLYI